MTPEEELAWQHQVLRLAADGKVSRTFRRLDPPRQMAVIEALLSDAAEHGVDAVNVRRVARAAGVSVGSLYQYFPHREGMLEFAAKAGAGFLTAALDAYRPQMAALPLREGLLAYLTFGVEWSRGYAGLLGFFARTAYQGVPGYGEVLVRPVAASMRGLLAALLDGARERGELRPGVDVPTAVRLIHAMTINLGDTQLLPFLNDYLQLFDDDHPPTAICTAAVEFMLDAIAAEGRTK
nr:TetR/AcrR family transcriptional regulator [Streptomyces sp. NBC_00886]